ncbi:MAG: hypothetical protein KBD16_02975 [Candidatus Pacebacteria bacterium]|nr:hypothetical protein [Candidatus Paceibacterota bacterium]
MRSTFFTSLARVVLISALIFTVFTPRATNATSNKLTCSLSVTTPTGETTMHAEKDVLLKKGDVIEIEWESTNAKKAVDGKGDTIALSGSATSSPQKNTTYSYRFSSGSKKVMCTVSVVIASGSITKSSLSSDASKPTLSGKATGVKTVQVVVYKEDTTKPLYTSKSIKVKRGSWKVKVSKKLPDGAYDVVVRGPKDMGLNTLATGTLVIGDDDAGTSSATTLVVKSVPLLSGGIARGGSSVAVSYLQVINVGKEMATLKSFALKQNGSASTQSIITLTSTDDIGTSKSSTGGAEGSTPFKNGIASVPTNATIAAGETRLFTIKAVLTSNVSSHIGKQLMIDVAGVTANASVKGAFPIRGTTWTIGY